jgi:hypothetical protein
MATKKKTKQIAKSLERWEIEYRLNHVMREITDSLVNYGHVTVHVTKDKIKVLRYE